MSFSFKYKKSGNIKVDEQKELIPYPETVYIFTSIKHSSLSLYTESFSEAHGNIEDAVPVGEVVEVGIYQLVRTAKFQKTAVEVKTLKEIKDEIRS